MNVSLPVVAAAATIVILLAVVATSSTRPVSEPSQKRLCGCGGNL
jgi:hypothetical protein